jgi:hypothetical protein
MSPRPKPTLFTRWIEAEAGRDSSNSIAVFSASSVAASSAFASSALSAGRIMGCWLQKLAATSLTVSTVKGTFLIAASLIAHSSAYLALADPSTPAIIPGISRSSFRQATSIRQPYPISSLGGSSAAMKSRWTLADGH